MDYVILSSRFRALFAYLIPHGAAQLRDAHHALAGRTDRNRQPHAGTQMTNDDPNIRSRNGQKGGRGYEATTEIVHEPKSRTL